MDFLLKPIFIYVLAFLAVVLPVLLWRRDTEGDVESYGPGGRNLSAIYKLLWEPIMAFEMILGMPLANFFPSVARKYERWARASSLPLNPARVFTLKVFCAVGGLVIGVALVFAMRALFPDVPLVWPVLGGIFLVLVGWIYPSMTLENYVIWRKAELMRALPFAIDLIGSAMRSGLEFGAAMRYFTGLRMAGPLTEEFGSVLQQIELGKTRTEALADMADRVQVEAFTSFVGVVAYGSEIGASIADTLKVHGDELRRARFHLAERKAARAPSLMIFPMALFIMPAVFIIIITPVIMQMKGTGIGGH